MSTSLWYDSEALPAAEFYCSLLPNSRVEAIEYYPEGQEAGEPGTVLEVSFFLDGAPFKALNGGPHYKLSPAVSVTVMTDGQEETDRLWNALVSDGGSELQCGWLTDRFGLSWQIFPSRLVELMKGPGAAKVWAAMTEMQKFDMAKLEEAAAAD